MLKIVNLHEDSQMKLFVGNRLKYFREKKGISQHELGEILGVKNNSISAYERGKRAMSLEQLNIVADYFHVSIDDFFPRNEELYKLIDHVGDNNFSVDDKEMINSILDAGLRIDKDKRNDFYEKLDILIQLYR